MFISAKKNAESKRAGTKTAVFGLGWAVGRSDMFGGKVPLINNELMSCLVTFSAPASQPSIIVTS